jgi:hypothetical protein
VELDSLSTGVVKPQTVLAVERLAAIIIFISNLTPWKRVLLQELIRDQLDKKFPTFNGTLRFIANFRVAGPRKCLNKRIHLIETVDSHSKKKKRNM